MNKTSRALLPVLMTAFACTSLVGCSADADSDSEEEMWDEGPLAQDEKSDEGNVAETSSAITANDFQLPFPCGQVWSGQTRTNHSPPSSVDFNRTDDYGDTVVAAAAGTVTRVENLGSTSYGRWVEVSHGSGWTTRYAHLSMQSVARGQHVARGQKIGNVGSTGGSTGPHLHFEERRNGVAVRATFNGSGALYWGTRSYTSHNACASSSGASGRVDTAGAPLTIRAAASTSSAAVGSLSDGQTVSISCQKKGEKVEGTFGTSTLWDKVGGGFVADAYIFTGADGRVAPDCN
ncbi:MAG: uncharacterized protein JWP97_3963 [Labilithrix sp.]|nr:uncharacterized protein [Labilithrix sp.]